MNLLSTTVATLLVACASPLASADAQASGDAAASGGVSAALVNLTVELHALQTIVDSVGNMRTNSEDRIEAMNAYMKERKIDGGFAAFAASAQMPPSTSFLQGYQAAASQEKLNGVPAPATTDLGLLTREVAAMTTEAQSAWNDQNDRFAKVAVLSAYLQSKNEFVGYQKWAPGYCAKKRAAQADRYKAANAAYNAQQQVYLQHIQEMHEQWDKIPHGTGIDYNYGFSQGNGPNEGGTGQSANTGGVGVNSPTAVGVNTPWAYAGAQGGFYAGAYGANAYNTGGVPTGNQYDVNLGGGYYGGTNYNSYSDCYPDVWGYPEGTSFDANAFNAWGINNIWNRNRNNGALRTPAGIGGAGRLGPVGGASPAGGAGHGR